MRRLALAIILAFMSTVPAMAKDDCVTLDGVMQICPTDGVHNLGQFGVHLIGLGIAEPGSAQIYGMAVEIADGCRFGLFEGRYASSTCKTGSLEEMATRWANEYLYTDSTEIGGVGRMKLLDIDAMTVGGRPGYMAHYHSDFSGTGYGDTWEALFVTEISGRYFLFNAFDIAEVEPFDAMTGRIAYVLSLLSPVDDKSTATGYRVNLVEFLAGQGCAIGPGTRNAALAAGYEIDEIDALIEIARRNPDTVETGDWLVLPTEICNIRLPTATNELKLTDPEVRKSISARDAYLADDEPGCFFDHQRLFEELRKTRSWDDDKIDLEYIRLIGSSITSGDIRFYTDDPLRTPVGFQLMTGECADVPHISEIRRSHAALTALFDPLIRANAANVACENGASLVTPEFPDIAQALWGSEVPNAWLAFEIQMIAMGAGWYEGISMSDKGTPRPPLCHYE